MPNDPDFGFLGTPGQTVWVAPQGEEEGKLFLALAADNLPTDVFTDDQIVVTLEGLEGPGEFSVYETDSLGGLQALHYDTRDGIDEDDTRSLVAGDHYHMNWGFTEAGTYTIRLQARGTLSSSGEEITSPVTEFTFRVGSESGPRLAIVRADEDQLMLQWPSESGTRYQLQHRDAWETGSWEDHGSPIDGNGEIQTEILGEPSTGAARFYRLIEMP